MLKNKLPKILTGILAASIFAVGTCYAIDKVRYTNTLPSTRTTAPQDLKSNDFSMPLLEGGVSITRSPRLITMSLRDSDVKQVLRMLADKAGMNIIMHESVSGTITLDLVNVTLNKAFEYVMVMNGLAYWVDGNTLIVSSKEASKELAFSQQKIKTFDVKYENAGRIAEFLNKNIYKLKNPGLSNDDIAMSNPNTNQIMIIGTDKDFEIARKIIAQFDKKVDTTMFKVNHMAPGKMAGIVCHKVFRTEEIKDEDGDSEGKGGAKIACSSKDIEGSEVEGTFESFKSTGMVVTYYPDLGTIGVSGATKEQLDLVDEVIAQNDIKQPQAILEIAILELSAQGSKTIDPVWGISAGTFSLGFSNGTLGIDFNTNVNDQGRYISSTESTTTSMSSNASSTSATSSDTSSSNAGVTTTTTTAGDAYMGLRTRITIAMQQGKGRVLSNPKLIVKNNVESTLDITQEYVSNITTQIATGSIQAVGGQTVETDDYGIKISIKPTITPDGYIYMDLKPSYSVPNNSFQVDSSDSKKKMQLLAERNLDLKGIRLKDNETLIIGGLIQETEDKSTTKVPVLGDLPVVGAAFRSSAKTSNKNELIIIVTPKILNDDEAIMERM